MGVPLVSAFTRLQVKDVLIEPKDGPSGLLMLYWHEEERADLESGVTRIWSVSPCDGKMPYTTAENLRRGLQRAGFRVLQVTPQVQGSATNGPLGVNATHTDNRAELIAVRI